MVHLIIIQVLSLMSNFKNILLSLLDRSKYDDQLDGTFNIPCELCNQLIESRYYMKHLVSKATYIPP